MNHYEEILDKISTANIEIEKIDRRLATASMDELEKLAEQLAKIQTQKQGLNIALIKIRDAELQQEEAAKKAIEAQERQRKLSIIEYLQKHPPRCLFCQERSEMKRSKDCTGQEVRPNTSYSDWNLGMASPSAQWYLQYICYQVDCPGKRKVQVLHPDRKRIFDNGDVDADFPVLLKEEKTVSRGEKKK